MVHHEGILEIRGDLSVYHNDKDILLTFGGQVSGMLECSNVRDSFTQPRIILGSTWLSISYWTFYAQKSIITWVSNLSPLTLYPRKESTGSLLVHLCHKDVVLCGLILCRETLLLSSPVKKILGCFLSHETLMKAHVHLAGKCPQSKNLLQCSSYLCVCPLPSFTLFCPENSLLFHQGI